MKKGIVCFLIIIGGFYLIFLLASNAVGAEGIDIGPCTLKPVIQIEERYETNIFLLPTDRKGDFISTITPECLIEYKSANKSFITDYKYEFIHYGKYRDEDNQNHKIKTEIKIKGEEYFLHFGEDYKQVTDISSYEEGFSDYDLNDAYITVGADLNHFSFDFTYENLDYTYQLASNTSDYNQHTFDAIGYYEFLPKTKALLEYTFDKLKYDNDPDKDGDFNELLFGATGELTQKIDGTLKFGYFSRDYKNKNDWEEPVTYVNLLYGYSPHTSFDLTLERSAKESTYTTENYCEVNEVTLGITQSLTAKTTAYITGSYEYNKYPAVDATTATRKDDLWDFDIALSTNIRKWLTSEISYEFEKRASNTTYDYENNITAISLKASY